MKISSFKIVLISVISLFVVSCSSSETKAKKVAEECLNHVANGLYYGYSDDLLYRTLSIVHSDFAPNEIIENYRAALFKERETIHYNEMDLSPAALLAVFFDMNRYLFRQFHYLKVDKYTEDFYRTRLYGEPESKYDFWKGLEKVKDKPGFEQYGYDYIYIIQENVPVYRFTYEADNLYWVHVTVAFLKGQKPKVTSVKIGPIQIDGVPVQP